MSSWYLNIWLFGHIEKRLDQKNKVNFKIYDVTIWETNNCNTHISQHLGNQAIRQWNLVNQKEKNIFLEKWYAKCSGETIPRPFSKKSKLSISLDQLPKFFTGCFCCTPSWGLSNILKLSCRPLIFSSNKAFLRNKKRSGTSLSASISTWFLNKNIYIFIFY